MNAQQAQGQVSRWSRRVRTMLFACALLGLVAAAVFWLLNIQPVVFSSLFGASGVIIGLIALYPIIFPAKTPEPVSPQVTVNTPVHVDNVVPPAPINIYNVLPPSQPAPQVQVSSTPSALSAPGSQSQAALAAGPYYANPLSLRSLPLPGGAKHIQRREKNVKEIYAQLIEPGVSAVALCGIGGVGKSTLAAPVWLDTAREYTERWLHQQQIRDAVHRPGLKDRKFFHPVLDTFVRALPHTYRDVVVTGTTVIKLVVTGEAGDVWYVVGEANSWSLYKAVELQPVSVVTMDQEMCWRLFTRGVDKDRARIDISIEGDVGLGEKMLDTVSIIA